MNYKWKLKIDRITSVIYHLLIIIFIVILFVRIFRVKFSLFIYPETRRQRFVYLMYYIVLNIGFSLAYYFIEKYKIYVECLNIFCCNFLFPKVLIKSNLIRSILSFNWNLSNILNVLQQMLYFMINYYLLNLCHSNGYRVSQFAFLHF